MAVVRFDPFRGFERINKRMGQFVDEMEKGFRVEYGSFAPTIDIVEDEKTLKLFVELPGIPKEQVKITVNEDKVLIIKGEKKRCEEETDECKEKAYIRAERSFGEFSRSFQLPENINTDSINAKFENGVLSISLSKKEPVKPKEVEVTID